MALRPLGRDDPVEAGLAVSGFVLSQPSPETDASASSNAEMIAALTGLPCWGVLPHAASFEVAAAALRLPTHRS